MRDWSRRRTRWFFLAVVIAAGGAAAASRLGLGNWAKTALEAVERLGAWGPVALIGCYVVGAVLFVPGLILTLGAGAVFGVVNGCVIASLGSTLGATAAFLVSRYLLRRRVASRLEGNNVFRAIDRAVTRDGWRIVMLARLSPIFPYVLLNHAFALTRISVREYVIASWLGMIPATALYTYLGSLVQTVTGQRSRTTAEWILYGVGLVATLVIVVYFTRVARESLGHRMISEPAKLNSH